MARAALFVLLCAGFGVVCALLLGTSARRVGPVEMRLSMRYALPGRTEIAMNPFGRITAHTHGLPVAFIASVESIDVDETRDIIDKGLDVKKIKRRVKSGGVRLFAMFLLKLFLLGAVGGALGAALGRRLHWKRLLAGMVSGTGAVALLLAAVGLQFNPAAFNHMKYSGALSDAAYLLPELQEEFHKGLAFRERLGNIAENLAAAYITDDKKQRGHDTIRALHISDLHNNPLGAEMVCRINAALDPDIILDTGDISDLGLPLELKLVHGLKCLDAPHVFVAGNHELPGTMDELKKEFDIIAPGGNMVEVEGLRIIGFDAPPPFSGKTEIAKARIKAWAGDIRKTLDAQPKKPDVIMLHYPDIGHTLAGRAPVILFGHTHEASAETHNGSLLINAGSAGASGVRYLLRTKEKSAYTVALITFKKQKDRRPAPLHADIITFDHRTGLFTVQRTPFEADGG